MLSQTPLPGVLHMEDCRQGDTLTHEEIVTDAVSFGNHGIESDGDARGQVLWSRTKVTSKL